MELIVENAIYHEEKEKLCDKKTQQRVTFVIRLQITLINLENSQFPEL